MLFAQPTLLTWDSEFFGFVVVSYQSQGATRAELDAVMEAAARMGATLLVFSDPAPSALRAAQLDDVALVDTRCTYTLDLENHLRPSPLRRGSLDVYEGRESDALFDQLGVMSGLHSRYFHDPRFPRQAAEALYLCWVRRALSREYGDLMLVTRDVGDNIVGMLSTRVDSENFMVPDLMAVLPSMRGHGHGAALFDAATQYFRGKGFKYGRLRAQERNVWGRRIYELQGWQPVERDDIYHCWLQTPTVKSNYFRAL